MNRAKRYFKSLGSNYLLLLANAFFTFASIPIALHYLSKQEFGVWIVVGQIAGYLAMIDLGTNSAGIRLLIDHKDAPNEGGYGSLIKTAILAQAIQASLILVAGAVLMPLMSDWLNVPSELIGDFNVLWLWQIALLSCNFVARIAVQVLTAHQRPDVVNYSQIGGLVANFAALLLSFKMGFGIYSLALGQTVAFLIVVVWSFASAMRLRLFPSRWGTVTRDSLRGLMGFSSEVFLVGLGAQMITTSQTFLLTRLLGFEAASLWSVMTKVFTMLTQIVWRTIGMAAPVFSEMLVRGEHERLHRRYRSVFELSILASCFFGLLLALGNNAFVNLWTKGRMHWEPANDWLLGLWFIFLTQGCSHTTLIVNSKRLYGVKYIYFAEGLVFIVASLLIVPRAGITGMLFCSTLCTILFTGSYGARRVANFFEVSPWKVGLVWLVPAARLAAAMLPMGILLAQLTRNSDWGRLVGCVFPTAVLGIALAVRLGIPRDLRAEFITHLPKPLRRFGTALAGI